MDTISFLVILAIVVLASSDIDMKKAIGYIRGALFIIFLIIALILIVSLLFF